MPHKYPHCQATRPHQAPCKCPLTGALTALLGAVIAPNHTLTEPRPPQAPAATPALAAPSLHPLARVLTPDPKGWGEDPQAPPLLQPPHASQSLAPSHRCKAQVPSGPTSLRQPPDPHSRCRAPSSLLTHTTVDEHGRDDQHWW